MTEHDFYSLENNINVLYEFYLYYDEIPLVGHLIQTNPSKEEYRVLTNSDLITVRDKNISYDKLGTSVKLDSITKWSLYDNRNSSQYISNPISYDPAILPKKMVIFGAGASHDFTYDSKVKAEDKPPLTKDIFDDRYEIILSGYTPARNLSSSIIRHKDGIEDYFQKQWERMENHTDEILYRNLLNTQYYLYHLFRDVSQKNSWRRKSNYYDISKLAREYAESKGECVLFVSFNYDTLIENSLSSACQYVHNTIDDYIDIKTRKILLFKPHGSCNWGRKFIKGFPSDKEIKQGMNNISLLARHIYEKKLNMPALKDMIEDKITIHRYDGMQTGDIYSDKLFFPHLLLPYKDKDDFAMPSHHTALLKSYLSKIEEILIVGWKGTEAEFQKLLNNFIGHKKLKITVVTNTSEDIRDKYKGVFPKMNEDDWTFHKGGFSKYMDEGNRFFPT